MEGQQAPEAENRPSPMSVLWPAYMCVFVDFMGLALTIPIQPFLADEFGATPAQISMLVGVFSAGQLVGNLIMGRLSDKIGRKPIIIASLVASTVSYVGCGMATGLNALFLARGLCGICGGTMPVAQAMILDVVSDFRQRPKYLGLCGAALGMGFVVGPAVGAASFAAVGVSGAFFVCAALSGFAVLVAASKVQETNPSVLGQTTEAKPAGPPAEGPGASGRPAAGPSKATPPPAGFGMTVWACALSMFLNAYCFATMNGIAPLTLNTQFGWTAVHVGIFLTAVGVLQILMNAVIAPWLVNRVGAALANVVGSLLSGVGILYPAIRLLGPQLMFWLALCWGWALQQPTLSTAIGAVVHPAKRGAAMGLMMGLMSLGRTLSPFCAGALYQSQMILTEDYKFTQVGLSVALPPSLPPSLPRSRCLFLPLSDGGTIAQVDGLFAREERDPTCVGSELVDGVIKPCVTAACTATLVEATGCIPPNYAQEFQTVFSLSPYILSACVSGLAVLLVLVAVPLDTGKASTDTKGREAPAAARPPTAASAP